VSDIEIVGRILDDGSFVPAIGDDALMDAAIDCGERGGELLCRHAKIPEACREQFVRKMRLELMLAFLQAAQSSETIEAIEEIEASLRKTYEVFVAAPPAVQLLLTFADTRFPIPPGEITFEMFEMWTVALKRMIGRCSRFTGRGAHRAVPKRMGPGRRRGSPTKATLRLKMLIWKIARAVKQYGGKLTLSRHDKSGTWVDALNGLRPLFPKNFVPKSIPFTMIEGLQTKSNKTPLPRVPA
jgi:hypothetical protein